MPNNKIKKKRKELSGTLVKFVVKACYQWLSWTSIGEREGREKRGGVERAGKGGREEGRVREWNGRWRESRSERKREKEREDKGEIEKKRKREEKEGKGERGRENIVLETCGLNRSWLHLTTVYHYQPANAGHRQMFKVQLNKLSISV